MLGKVATGETLVNARKGAIGPRRCAGKKTYRGLRDDHIQARQHYPLDLRGDGEKPE